MKGFIHSIESFGTVDGPGVRFVVFFQGCPMRCLYCHNPDTWVARGGTEHEPEEVLNRMLRNLPFYETGGITASGGEPLMQMDFLIELFALAKERGIHTALDTSGITFDKDNTKKFDLLMDLCDLVMLDIKHSDDGEHQRLTSHSNRRVFDFLDYLKGKGKAVWIRHVIVPDITYNHQQLYRLGELLRGYDNIEKIEVLPYHNLGQVKYDRLGIDYPLSHTKPLTRDDARIALDIINSAINA
ncbi:MAG: pyruvate formate lyase-activating protein [Clostridia bacterium]|nr:pyruvate formate lyase-activating protein [Clostridia bacterium]